MTSLYIRWLQSNFLGNGSLGIWMANMFCCKWTNIATQKAWQFIPPLRRRSVMPKAFPCHGDVIIWKHFSRYWLFVRGIHRSPVNSPHKGQWRGALMFPLICVLNKRLSKQSWGWWFETPSRSLRRQCTVMTSSYPVHGDGLVQERRNFSAPLQTLVSSIFSNK